MSQQRHIHEIADTNKAALHPRHRNHAARIMRRHRFDVAAMWQARTAHFAWHGTHGRCA